MNLFSILFYSTFPPKKLLAMRFHFWVYMTSLLPTHLENINLILKMPKRFSLKNHLHSVCGHDFAFKWLKHILKHQPNKLYYSCHLQPLKLINLQMESKPTLMAFKTPTPQIELTRFEA